MPKLKNRKKYTYEYKMEFLKYMRSVMMDTGFRFITAHGKDRKEFFQMCWDSFQAQKRASQRKIKRRKKPKVRKIKRRRITS